MQKRRMIISILISAALPLGLDMFYENHLNTLYALFWIFANYLFVMTIWERFVEYRKIFKLPNLKVNKFTYILNMIYYFGFLIFLNVYFSYQMYLIDVEALAKFSNSYILFAIFILFVVNLFYGKFPEKEEKDNPQIYSMPLKGHFRNGTDKFGTVVGSYEDGLVLGTYYFPFDTMKSISINKEDEVAIRGKDDEGNYIVNIGARKSAVATMKVLLDAEKSGKLDKKVNNIKLKKF